MIALTEKDRAELQRIKRKLDSIRGPGIVNTPDSISINPVHGSNRRRGSSGGGDLPTGQYQGMVYLMVSGSQAGWDFVRAHADVT